jgi:hypothetical protein
VQEIEDWELGFAGSAERPDRRIDTGQIRLIQPTRQRVLESGSSWLGKNGGKCNSEMDLRDKAVPQT